MIMLEEGDNVRRASVDHHMRLGRYSPLYSWLSVCRKNPRTFSMESLVTASLYSNRCPPEFIPVRKPQPRQIKPVVSVRIDYQLHQGTVAGRS
jgi:hypothetical protein